MINQLCLTFGVTVIKTKTSGEKIKAKKDQHNHSFLMQFRHNILISAKPFPVNDSIQQSSGSPIGLSPIYFYIKKYQYRP